VNAYYLFRESSVFLQKLYNAVCQLRMVHTETLDFVQRNEYSGEEQFVFLLQWQGESIDNGAQDLEKFGNSVESLRLVDELEEDVVDRATDVRAEVQELAVYAV
jgi:hypothetical protein